MNRAEEIMMTYFECKEDYTKFKLTYRVESFKNINSGKNSELNVRNADGDLRCYEGKPSIITVGKTFDVSDTPIYFIGWLNFCNGSGKYHRPAVEGPATIRASKRDGQRLIIFSFYEDDRLVIANANDAAAYVAAHRSAHEKATGVAYDKFTTVFRA